VNTVDDLLHTLEQHTGLAPDGAGMVEQARAGARRIRRRRRITTAVAAVAAAILVAVGVPFVAHHRTTPATPAPIRSSSDMSIGLAADSGFVLEQRAADGARQLLVAHEVGTKLSYGFGNEVWAYDPGAFDPKNLPPGETVRVGGHDALLVPALSKDRLDLLRNMGGFRPTPTATPSPLESGEVLAYVNTNIDAAVVWQDPSGIWVTVTKVDSRDALLRLAAAVRVGPASPPLGPVGLSWLPDPLAVTHAETMETFPGMYAKITLTVPEPDTNAVPAESAASAGPGNTRVEIYVEHRDGNQWNDGRKLPKSTLMIAGHPAWYSEGEVDGYTFSPTEGRLLIETDTCGIRVVTDDFTTITGAELRQMMNLATYGSCTDMTDWTPVVP
jgi:hypothetical protein